MEGVSRAFRTQPGRANKQAWGTGEGGKQRCRVGVGQEWKAGQEWKTGQEQATWAGRRPPLDPRILTAVGFVSSVLTVKITITAPQLEGTMSIPTGELIGLTGWWGSTVQLIAAVLAVLLSVAEVVSGDAVTTVACGLLGPTGQGPDGTGKQGLRSVGDWWLSHDGCLRPQR